VSLSNFPNSIDNFPDPAAGQLFDDPVNPHNLIEGRQNDAIEAIETVLGVTGSVVPGTVVNDLAAINAVIPLPAPGNPLYYLASNGTWSIPSVSGSGSTSAAVDGSITSAPFLIPAVGSTVPVSFANAKGFLAGQTLAFLDSSYNFVYLEVTQVNSTTSATLINRGYPKAGSGIGSSAIAYVSSPGIATATSPGLLPLPPNNTTTFLRGDATFDVPPTVTTGAPGYAPTLPSSTVEFLRGDGSWAMIPPVSSGAAGLAPEFPNNTTTFLRGDGTYAAVPTATATAGGLLPLPPNNTTTFLRGDATFVAVPAPAVATATSSGLVPTPPNNTTTFLRGDATFAAVPAPAVATATSSGLVPTPPNNTTTFLRGDATFSSPALSTDLGSVSTNQTVSCLGFTHVSIGLKITGNVTLSLSNLALGTFVSIYCLTAGNTITVAASDPSSNAYTVHFTIEGGNNGASDSDDTLVAGVGSALQANGTKILHLQETYF
jgi:hypothetical protein